MGIPRFPHSCSLATTNMADVVVNLVQSAFTQLGDGHGLAQGNLCFSAGMGVVSGRDWRRGGAEYINQVYLMGGGGPALPEHDGMIYLLTPGGCGLLHRDSIEFDEQRFPMLIRSQRLLPDSGGAGPQAGRARDRGDLRPAPRPDDREHHGRRHHQPAQRRARRQRRQPRIPRPLARRRLGGLGAERGDAGARAGRVRALGG